MPVVGFTELHKHASDRGYGLVVANVKTLSVVKGVIEASNALDAPVVLAVEGSILSDGLLPSLEAMARQTQPPVVLLASDVRTADQASQAIRSGCNALAPAQDSTDSDRREIRNVAASCGIDLIAHDAITAPMVEVDDELEAATLAEAAGPHASWQALEKAVAEAASQHMKAVFNASKASGKGSDALATCQPWRPVEHLIIYNTTTDEAGSEAMAAEGRRVLDRIPGVRATWSGQSVKDDAAYRWCWLIRFAHPAVIDSYREHPDHVAYADNHFRPVAGDRISIDYRLTGADEER